MPISDRVIFVSHNISPSTDKAVNREEHNNWVSEWLQRTQSNAEYLPLVLPCDPLRAIISRPSSRRLWEIKSGLNMYIFWNIFVWFAPTMWFSVSDIPSLCTPISLSFPRAPSYRPMFLHRLYPAESLPPKMQSADSHRNNAIDVKNLFFSFLCWVFNATHGTHLHFHGIGIHLAHVLATVLHSNVSYDQCPCVVIVVCHRQPIAVRDDVFVYRQNGLCIGFYPRNLSHSTHIFWTCGCLCGCVRYLCNGRMRCECF